MLYPADAEDGYGWEKLYMERVCRHYTGRLRTRYKSGSFPTTSSGRLVRMMVVEKNLPQLSVAK